MIQKVKSITTMSKPVKTLLNIKNGLYFVHSSPQTLQIYDPRKGGSSFLDLPPQNILSFPSPLKVITFTADGKEMACGLESGEIKRVTMQNFDINSVTKKHSSEIIVLAYSKKNQLASYANDKKIGFHNLSNGNVKFGKVKKGVELQTMVWVNENH
ncbi:MAG: hypothetical protein ACXAC7_22215, partial [Candidatus Hodarchaeales archaeon]